MLLIHKLDHLRLNLLLKPINLYRLFTGLFQVSSSLLDEVILLFHLFFDVFHVILDIVNVLDSLLSRRGGDVVEDLQNFDVLFL